MTYEQAVYFKILIICGYFDEYEQFVENSLANENIPCDLVVDLAYCGSNEKHIISVLTEYILQIDDVKIDYDYTVFPLLLNFLHGLYVEQRLTLRELTELMHQIAILSGREWYEPWKTMYLMEDYLADAEWGIFKKYMKDFSVKLERFLKNEDVFSV